MRVWLTAILACSASAAAAQAADFTVRFGGVDASSAALAGAPWLSDQSYEPGAGLIQWSVGQTQSMRRDGAVDTLTVSQGRLAARPAFIPRTPDEQAFDGDQQMQVTLTRDWPAMMRLLGRRYGVDLSPHAGVGMGGEGGSAEAGATVRFGKNLEQRVSNALGGVRDGASFRDQGRWYIYAAASGKAVGLNMLRGEDGDWRQAGWSSDPASRVIANAQTGVAWRKGPMQAAFGYLQRRAKVRKEVEGVDTRADSMVAFSFSLTPRW